MSRPLRISYPGAWYHVMNRGRRSEPVFLDKKDYRLFIGLLKEISELWNVNVSAYCLMTNHYHILLQTPDANVSRAMRHLNSVYTQRFNKAHGFDGPLFRGRYKSVLVCDDSHLLELVRYIHKNPVKAGLTDNLKAYKWSSYNGYLSYSKTWDWLYKDHIFSMLTPQKRGRLAPFVKFMEKDDSEAVKRFFSLKNLPSMFGPESFINRIKEEFYFKKRTFEVPASKGLAPEPEKIIKQVCLYYQVSREDLSITRRGWFNKPRNIAIYLIRFLRSEQLIAIADMFAINGYSTVSSVVQRVGDMRKRDNSIQQEIDEIIESLGKSQIKT